MVAENGHRVAPGFVGRRAELETLSAAPARTLAGQPAVVAVQGPAGIGKTTLLRSFLAGLAGFGWPG